MQGPVTSAEVPVITPFWQRMPYFFRYPLHVEPLLYMAMLSLATLLGFILPLSSPLDHLIVHLGVWLAFIRYAYKTLDQTSLGLLTPEQHQFYDAKERANLPYKQFAIFLVTGFAISLAGFLGNVAVGLMMIFFVLAMPASIMILSITQSFWAGLNPFAAVGMMRIIGLPYLGLCAFLFLLSSSQGILQMELVPRVPEWLMIPTLNFVAMYFTLIMFNMMGYAVYQHHHELGVEADVAPAVADSGNERQAVLGRLVAMDSWRRHLIWRMKMYGPRPTIWRLTGAITPCCCCPTRTIAWLRTGGVIFQRCSANRAAARRRCIGRCLSVHPTSRPSVLPSCCVWPRPRAKHAITRMRLP